MYILKSRISAAKSIMGSLKLLAYMPRYASVQSLLVWLIAQSKIKSRILCNLGSKKIKIKQQRIQSSWAAFIWTVQEKWTNFAHMLLSQLLFLLLLQSDAFDSYLMLISCESQRACKAKKINLDPLKNLFPPLQLYTSQEFTGMSKLNSFSGLIIFIKLGRNQQLFRR